MLPQLFERRLDFVTSEEAVQTPGAPTSSRPGPGANFALRVLRVAEDEHDLALVPGRARRARGGADRRPMVCIEADSAPCLRAMGRSQPRPGPRNFLALSVEPSVRAEQAK